MKKALSVVLMIAILLLCCSCGLSAENVKDRLKEMEENEEIHYALINKASLKEMKETVEKDRYEKFKGEIEKGYVISDKSSATARATVLFFEETKDAKQTVEYLKDKNEDKKDFAIVRKGTTLIYGTEKLVKEIKK